MIEEARSFNENFRLGVAAGLKPLQKFKRAADFLFVQASFSLEALLQWRSENPVDVPVYAGVLVLASHTHAQRLATAIPDIDIPQELIDRLATDRMAGVETACDLVMEIKESGAFDGVHMIPVSRYRDVESRLSSRL